MIVDNNLLGMSEYCKPSSLSDTFFHVVEGLPDEYANLKAFTTLSGDCDTIKFFFLLLSQQ